MIIYNTQKYDLTLVLKKWHPFKRHHMYSNPEIEIPIEGSITYQLRDIKSTSSLVLHVKTARNLFCGVVLLCIYTNSIWNLRTRVIHYSSPWLMGRMNQHSSNVINLSVKILCNTLHVVWWIDLNTFFIHAPPHLVLWIYNTKPVSSQNYIL